MSDDKLLDQISENLSRIRKEQRYTQREVANMAGLNPNYYAKVERGDGMPSLKTIHKLAKALKVNASEIVGF
ncbi:XRE family transcriptional regulator [Candidatus Saccharibacteria bacterium]|nr:XRE family transcriptional regulator [Candidatus Saccharibacteria bacterium]NCU38613.1 XRE family transcriptional regulator [Candidatus Saccharibacteria bacterium]